MFISAEIRWFWRHTCSIELEDWFFRRTPLPGGGTKRTDVYLRHSNERVLGIKQRGTKAGLEIKGLIAVLEDARLQDLSGHYELWCKWTSDITNLASAKSVA